jgi:hypothetical protein
VTVGDCGRRSKYRRVALYFASASFIVPVERQVEILFESFEDATKFAEEVAKIGLKTSGCGGCIPECFVGHYRVKYDTGLNYPG